MKTERQGTTELREKGTDVENETKGAPKKQTAGDARNQIARIRAEYLKLAEAEDREMEVRSDGDALCRVINASGDPPSAFEDRIEALRHRADLARRDADYAAHRVLYLLATMFTPERVERHDKRHDG